MLHTIQHWFQPLTGTTAEKHDSFFEPQDGRAVDKFSGDSLFSKSQMLQAYRVADYETLLKQEVIPHGIRHHRLLFMKTPVVKHFVFRRYFVSYTGEALDYKAPLLKSITLLDKAATDVCKYFYSDVTKVGASLGVEQEYFLVDKALIQPTTRLDYVRTNTFWLRRCQKSANGRPLLWFYP